MLHINPKDAYTSLFFFLSGSNIFVLFEGETMNNPKYIY